MRRAKLPSATRRRPGAGDKVDIRNVDFYYGKFKALQEHHAAAARPARHRVHRPVGLRQVDAAAHPEPHLRALSRASVATGEVLVDGENILAPGVDLNLLRARIGMVFQKPTPFPMSIYDNIAFGIRLYERLPKSELDDRVESALRGAALWDEVKDKLRQSGLEPVGRPAAAPVHRARDRGPARRSCCSTSRPRRSTRSRRSASRN